MDSGRAHLYVYATQAPHAFQLSQQLQDVRAASKVNLEIMKNDLKALHVGVREALAYVSSLEAAAGCVGDEGAGALGGQAVGCQAVPVLRSFLEAASKVFSDN